MIIKHAILHILDKDQGQLIASQAEMDINQSGIHEYFEKIIEKFNQGDFKTGQLQGDDYLAAVLDDGNGLTFAEKTTRLAEKLYDVIQAQTEIPAGDMLTLEFAEGQADFFAMFKVNFAPRYSHMVDYQADAMVNQLVLNQAILPGAGTTPEEGIIVNLMTGAYRLIEKQYRVDGHRTNYFSERFLEMVPLTSVKGNLQGVKQAVKHIANKFDIPEFEALATTQATIFQSVSEFSKIDTDEIAEAVFKDNVTAKEAYHESLQNRAINHEIKVDNSERYQKKYSVQKFKLASGIEISIPMAAYQDRDQVEFVNHPDGKLTLMIKNIDGIDSKFNA
ncbi:nucleoid-associated protein [Weissella soli]|uniref:nucleoid-associated protein n=1 Tax=Weissella soli TaxID=155866 RepID=UPI0035A1AA7F